MNQTELIQLKAIIAMTAAYFGSPLADEVIAMYAEDLADLPFASVIQAIKAVRRDPKITRFPLPAVIRSKLIAQENDEDKARDIAARLLAAIRRHGSYWTSGFISNGKKYYPGSEQKIFETWEEAAKTEIGELGIALVKRFGGWESICDFSENSNPSAFQAQIRDLALSIQNQARAGMLHLPPCLPNAKSEEQGLIALDAMKLLSALESIPGSGPYTKNSNANGTPLKNNRLVHG